MWYQLQLKVDHDLNPSVDDTSLPYGYEKNKFFYKATNSLKIDGGNVVSVKKCNTYYPKILPLK